MLRSILLLVGLTQLASILGGYLGASPPGCDEDAALTCEYSFLLCKLFQGPANDKETLCNCARDFYGSCLRLAGCEMAKEVGPLTLHKIYMKTCIDFIMDNNCPDPLICGTNCAADENIDLNTMKIIPFNNYGKYYLRIRTCLHKVHPQRLQRYSTIDLNACVELNDFEPCSRFIPPLTFVPVALPISTTYIEIDKCIVVDTVSTGRFEPYNVYECLTDETPARIYGNSLLFPRSYDYEQSAESECATDDDCLGTFCDLQYQPPICSAKSIAQALGTGEKYFSFT
jgi:hypothetical protein